MRSIFTSKVSSRLSPDISRSPRRTLDVFKRPQQIFKDAYAAAVKRRKKGSKAVVNQEGLSKLQPPATVDRPIGHHSNSYPPVSTSTQQTKSDTQETTRAVDAAHLQPLVEYVADESVTKPEVSDELLGSPDFLMLGTSQTV